MVFLETAGDLLGRLGGSLRGIIWGRFRSLSSAVVVVARAT